VECIHTAISCKRICHPPSSLVVTRWQTLPLTCERQGLNVTASAGWAATQILVRIAPHHREQQYKAVAMQPSRVRHRAEKYTCAMLPDECCARGLQDQFLTMLRLVPGIMVKDLPSGSDSVPQQCASLRAADAAAKPDEK
jgi:hypothetical protein